MSERPLVIYHGNCTDGFAAAWVAWKFFDGAADFHHGVYQNPPPDVAGRHVYLVDFSYKRVVLEAVRDAASSVTVLDHHKTAMEDLADFATGGADSKVRVTFDLERSGARIAWDHFFPGEDPPQLLLHVEDRDLWRFKLYATREISMALFSYPYDFRVWDRLMSQRDLIDLQAGGAAIERKHTKDIEELLGVVTRRLRIADMVIPVANLPHTLTSDAGHRLASGDPGKVGGCYWDTPDGRVFSLRSTDDGPDVSAIAKRYGGGGHAHAAGFRVGYDAARDFELGATR